MTKTRKKRKLAHKAHNRSQFHHKGRIAAFLHPHNQNNMPGNLPWRFLPYWLLMAFVLRAAVALSGDFVIHPDEVMQYLEPAHRLVFGSGVTYWEYFYGARSWIVPGIVAVVLWICKTAGLVEPVYYIAAVKLLLCTLSLLIPWGMYVFCRRHWSEQTARLALLFGVFWYVLVAFAHKPMTEFIATSLLVTLLAVMPFSVSHWRRAAMVGALCALIVAIRLQYAPPVGLIFIVSFWVANKNGRLAMLAGAVAMTVSVGILEMATWGAPFHSYYINIMVNLIIGAWRAGESSSWLVLLWLLLASGGLIALATFSVFSDVKRRGFVVLLALLIIVPHLLQNHREYRFIFATIPLWLMLLADFTAVIANQSKSRTVWLRVICACVASVSLLGIFNLIPFQKMIYTGFSRETGRVNFVHNQDPIFKIYQQLSADEKVRGVIDSTREYFNTGGYYYLGHAVPFYDAHSWSKVGDTERPAKYASHIIAGFSAENGKSAVSGKQAILETERGKIRLPAFVEDINTHELVYWDKSGRAMPLPDYVLQDRFTDGKSDELTLWRTENNAPVRAWKSYQVMVIAPEIENLMKKIKSSLATPPPNYGVEFVDSAGQ